MNGVAHKLLVQHDVNPTLGVRSWLVSLGVASLFAAVAWYDPNWVLPVAFALAAASWLVGVWQVRRAAKRASHPSDWPVISENPVKPRHWPKGPIPD